MSKQITKGFKSKLGFIAAAASSAVGVGNIWRFPYLTGKYGGANFIMLYLICVFMLGFPLVLAKLAFGRRMQGGTYNAYKNVKPKFWRNVGLGATIISFGTLSYYSVITGWLIGYFVNIAKGATLKSPDFSQTFANFVGDSQLNIFYTLITTMIILVIVKNGISDGIEKISKILMPIFIFMMLGLIIFTLSLKGSSKGLAFYLLPNWKAITPDAFYAALSQSFLSLSIGLGICVTYGAYVDKKDNLVKSSLIIVLSDTIVSLLAGLIIFPLIIQKGIEPNVGPGLIFISLPIAFKALGPFIGPLVGATFFMLLVFAAITSGIAMLEVVTKYIMERFKFSRSKSVYIIAFCLFLLGIPSILSNGSNYRLTNLWQHLGVTRGFLGIMDLFCGDLAMPIIGLFFSLFVAYKWKMNSLFDEIQKGSKPKKWFYYYLNITIKYISPYLISAIVILKLIEVFFGKGLADLLQF